MKLAIKGHPKRGNEVIERLEMLGGINKLDLKGTQIDSYYYIDSIDSKIHLGLSIYPYDYTIYTLEEFLEKFPYKVGDKVQYKGAISCSSIYVIEKMKWEDNQVKYIICDLYWKNCKCTVMSKDLQPYKEEAMKKEISGTIVDRFICLEGYDFYDDKGNIIDTKEITMKKQQKYPTTYEECCKVLDYCGDYFLTTYDNNGNSSVILNILNSISTLTKLLICRNVYWKIADDWKPEFRFGKKKHCVMTKDNKVISATVEETNRILVFPTEEMRDAFYENFKDLIEQCKELL